MLKKASVQIQKTNTIKSVLCAMELLILVLQNVDWKGTASSSTVMFGTCIVCICSLNPTSLMYIAQNVPRSCSATDTSA